MGRGREEEFYRKKEEKEKEKEKEGGKGRGGVSHGACLRRSRECGYVADTLSVTWRLLYTPGQCLCQLMSFPLDLSWFIYFYF